MGRGDPKRGTRWPGRKNGMSRPGRDVQVRDRGPGNGLAGHLLLPHGPTHPLNLLYYSTILNTFRFHKFAYWPVDYKSLLKERNCILRFGAKIPESLQLLWGTRRSSPTRCRINTCVRTSTFGSRDYHWSPMVAWWPLVPIGIIYLTGPWPLVTIDTNSHRCW